MDVVLPQWILTLDAELRAMVLCHEQEHRRARDPYLVLAAAMAVALMPWNIALWLMNRRLRLAIEMDCDARVLRAHPSRERYGRLILAVALRRSVSARLRLVPSFAQSTTHLERRISAMYSPAPLGRRATYAVATLALTTFAVACSLRTPPATAASSPANNRAAVDSFMAQQGVANWSYVRAAAGNTPPRYPDALRRSRTGGTVLAEFVVDTLGRVDDRTSISILSSSNELFAASVREALPAMRFVPAEVDGRRVKQLAQVPFEFRLDGSEAALPQDSGHKTTSCQKGTCPVLRLEHVVITAASR